MFVIVVISFFGLLFDNNGSYLEAAILLFILLFPLVALYLFSVFARNRKGSYVKFWRLVSYISFTASVIFLFVFSIYFVHCFNVFSAKKEISKAVDHILVDYKNMYDAYESQVGARVETYGSESAAYYNQYGSAKTRELLKVTYKVNLNTLKDLKEKWKEKMFTNHSANKKTMQTSIEKYERVLIDNFSIFSAASDLKNLVSEYNSHKEILEKDYSFQTPFEEYNNESQIFKFNNKEALWSDVEDYFKTTHSYGANIFIFLVFLVLAVFACSSYIFFKDSTVRAPKRNQCTSDVYSMGHQL